jgi:hypothetical protein
MKTIRILIFGIACMCSSFALQGQTNPIPDSDPVPVPTSDTSHVQTPPPNPTPVHTPDPTPVPDAEPQHHPRPVHPPEPKSDFLSRLYYGGGLNFNFSKYGYFADISPLIGYHITQKLSAGILATYQHYDFNLGYGHLQYNIYGGGVFGRYFILENIFAHAEVKALNGNWVGDQTRFNIYPVLVGGGYRGKLGERSSFYALVLYDINYSIYSPQGSPLSYTIGFGVGF